MGPEAWFAGMAVALSVGTIIAQFSSGKRHYLVPELSSSSLRPGTVALRVRISNSSERPKKLGPVFLLLGPVAENPVTTFNRLIDPQGEPAVCCAIDFEYHDLQPRFTLDEGLRCLIPLTYFTEENDTIGDEVLAFTYPLSGCRRTSPRTSPARAGCRA